MILLQVKIIIEKGDITKQHVDAIVNAANNYLIHGGGVAAAIAKAAGPELEKECKKYDYVETGKAVATTGGNLFAKYVIHTPGPIYRQNNPDQAQQLASCIISSLELAEKLHLQSIAFPAISTGIYGYPIYEAADIMIKAVYNYIKSGTKLKLIKFILYDEHSFKIFNETNIKMLK